MRNQFKRLPPVIAKLSRRTISHDFRYLRDWNRETLVAFPHDPRVGVASLAFDEQNRPRLAEVLG